GHGGTARLSARLRSWKHQYGAADRLLRFPGDHLRAVRRVQPLHPHHFLVYGIALLPFFWFNYWFVFVVPVFTAWMALDFGFIAVMLALCVIGLRASAKAG